MAISEFVIGEVIRLSVTFTDVLGVATDPSVVTVSIKTPDGEVEDFVTPDVVDDTGDGAFYLDYEITQAGDHFWRWEGTGTLIAANEGVFHGKESYFA